MRRVPLQQLRNASASCANLLRFSVRSGGRGSPFDSPGLDRRPPQGLRPCAPGGPNMRIHVGSALASAAFAVVVLLSGTPAQARITRIVMDRKATLAGQSIPYET